jgi:hypothetical protein
MVCCADMAIQSAQKQRAIPSGRWVGIGRASLCMQSFQAVQLLSRRQAS